MPAYLTPYCDLGAVVADFESRNEALIFPPQITTPGTVLLVTRPSDDDETAAAEHVPAMGFHGAVAYESRQVAK